MAWSPEYDRFPQYVRVGEKKTRANAALARLSKKAGKKGRQPQPVVIEGRKIATTFWGKAWCDNLESYADFAYRLERGRSYVRAGAVIDLEITTGHIEAKVVGTSLYNVRIEISKLPVARWTAIAQRCTGHIGSMVALLQGRLDDEVMRAVTERTTGLFPDPHQMQKRCSCPDWADTCKHVAAVLYGIGSRLDSMPALLFALRGVDPQDLVNESAGSVMTPTLPAARIEAADADLEALFGIDLGTTAAATKLKRSPDKPASKKQVAKVSAKTATKKKRKTAPKTTQAAAKKPASPRTRR
jgi:uncharacterized Zn finger protein